MMTAFLVVNFLLTLWLWYRVRTLERQPVITRVTVPRSVFDEPDEEKSWDVEGKRESGVDGN